jgi:hypothetical protein
VTQQGPDAPGGVRRGLPKMALMALVVLAVLAGSVARSLAANDMDRGGDRSAIVRCSLDGVNRD